MQEVSIENQNIQILVKLTSTWGSHLISLYFLIYAVKQMAFVI